MYKGLIWIANSPIKEQIIFYHFHNKNIFLRISNNYQAILAIIWQQYFLKFQMIFPFFDSPVYFRNLGFFEYIWGELWNSSAKFLKGNRLVIYSR